jgi:L-alanine-DL-glutamate epimerase-like enolase superfamily enzyme
MIINGLELYHIAIPFAEPYKLAKTYGTLHTAHAVIVKLLTDVGLVGLGEADPMIPFTDESPASVMAVISEIIAPYIIGKYPEELSQLESNLDRMVHGNLTARGAVNMALYDLLGKSTNMPVHQLLGGLYQNRLPLMLGIGSCDLDESIAAVEALVEMGLRTVMMKMGDQQIADEIKRFKAVRKHFGEELKIIVDANQGWDLFKTFDFIEGIKGDRLDLLEQPIERRDLNGLKRIHDRLVCPLSADESLVDVADAAELIREQVVDVLSIKVSKNGGLTRSKLIAQMAAGFGLKCLMNSMLEFGITQAASLHLGCTLANLMDCGHAYGSVTRMSDDITDFDRNISRAIVEIPPGPGLGVNLKEDKLKKYTIDSIKV